MIMEMGKSNKNNKILPITSPQIIGFLHHAYDLEILLSNELSLPFFYMNYIDLNFLKDNFFDRDAHYLDFCGANTDECIETHTFNQNNFFENELGICENIVRHIDQGWYVEVIVDEFSIPDRGFYKKHHFNHVMQIFGYGEKEFFASGFRANGIYGNHTVLFEDLIKAIITENGYTIKRVKDIDIELNTTVIRRKLLEYLNADDLSIKYPDYSIRHGGAGEDSKFYWGTDVYEGDFLYLDLLNKDEVDFDIRIWHILWEHKSCMLKRMTYMTEKGYADFRSQHIAYNEIERLAYMIRNKMFKFSFSQNRKLLAEVRDHLQSMKNLEMKEIKESVNRLDSK